MRGEKKRLQWHNGKPINTQWTFLDVTLKLNMALIMMGVTPEKFSTPVNSGSSIFSVL